MNSQEEIRSLEFLRKCEIELVNSREYRIGVKVCRLIDHVKKGKIVTFIREEKKYRNINKYNYEWKIPDNNYVYGDIDEEKKFVVYTCVTGNYDNLADPLFVAPNISYVAFTDNRKLKSDVWEIRPIDEDIRNRYDNILVNRYYKFHPYILGDVFDYAIYVDGNVQVCSDIRNLNNKLNVKTGIGFHVHSSRNCVYKEAQVCKLENKGNYLKIREQLKKYKEEGFPEKFGMYEANIILTDLKNLNSKKIMELWWNEFLSSKSYRDQLSLPYTVWKLGYKFNDIGILGYNMTKSPKFRKVKHAK